MGTRGYEFASLVTYRPGEVILEVGSGRSTRYLAQVGPPVVTVDAHPERCAEASRLPNVSARCGLTEHVLRDWAQPIGFAWLDGHDWPYTGNPANYYADQQADYTSRGQEYGQFASRASHLDLAKRLAAHTRVIAFDDTWQTHQFEPDQGGLCAVTVPPATQPALQLAMNVPLARRVCQLDAEHPHHAVPWVGWEGKGGTAIPYLLDHGFTVVQSGLCLVVLEKTEEQA